MTRLYTRCKARVGVCLRIEINVETSDYVCRQTLRGVRMVRRVDMQRKKTSQIYIYDEHSVYVMRKVLPGISMYDKTFLRNISEDSTYTRLRTVQG